MEVFQDEVALNYAIAQKSVNSFPIIPAIGDKCIKNVIYSYGVKMVKCLQDHIRMHYTPEETPALWLIIEHIEVGYPTWKQPTGANDAYNIGDRVVFEGNNYESVINANVWSPKVYTQGWKKI